MIGQIAWTIWWLALIAFVFWTLVKIVAWSFRLDDKEE